jgi:hypothetical protein
MRLSFVDSMRLYRHFFAVLFGLRKDVMVLEPDPDRPGFMHIVSGPAPISGRGANKAAPLSEQC